MLKAKACRRLAVVLVSAAVWLWAGSAVAQSESEAGFVHPAVQSYAREHSVSQTTARQHLDRIAPVQEILLSIMRLEAPRVAGSSIDHGADFMGWVSLVGEDPPSTDAAKIADAHPDVEIRVGAKHTYGELEAAQQRLSSDLFDQTMGDLETAARVSEMVVSIGIDVETNSVAIGLDPGRAKNRSRRSVPTTSGIVSDEEFAAEASWITETLQDNIPVGLSVADGRGFGPSGTFFGGVTMTIRHRDSCTSGFAAKQIGGPYGIITAGHCPEDQSMFGVPLPWVKGWVSRTADAQFHKIPIDSVHSLIDGYKCETRSPWCDVTGVATGVGVWRSDEPNTPVGIVKEGHHLCHTGRKTDTTCGKVTDIATIIRHSDGCKKSDGTVVNCSPVFIRVEGDELKACSGDSGGPWFDHKGMAYGIHYGGGGKDCNSTGKTLFFSAIWHVEDFLGVKVLTNPPSPPERVDDVTAEVVPGFDMVRVSWTKPSSEAERYVVYRRVAKKRYAYREIARTRSTTYVDPLWKLDPGSEYYYRVRAENNLGLLSEPGPGSYDGVVVPSLDKPRNLKATVNLTSVRVSWEAPTKGITRYVVYRRIALRGYQYKEIATTTNTEYYDRVSELKLGTEYYYRVRILKFWGTLGIPAFVGITIPGVPGYPNNVDAELRFTGVRVSWTKPYWAESYIVYRRVAKQGYPYRQIATTTNTYYTDPLSRLQPGTEYYYRVKAVNAINRRSTWGPGNNYADITTPRS